ncbi:MAG: hypothetical protein FJX72_04630 [Armatimonadetes bacterium]|nr:hypothetical protein [Armatimonadota bacterium]
MKTYVITPSAGKRLIGKATAQHPAVMAALASGTVVIVAGTTNGYVAEEVLRSIGDASDFSRRRFYRGITLPPSGPRSGGSDAPFPGDVVIVEGRRLTGKTIFDVVDGLGEGDVIVKGANALDLTSRRAAVMIGDPKGGTAAAAMQAVVGRRARLIVPVGLEKRVEADLDDLAVRLDSPGSSGPRLLPLIGEVVTEIEALELLTGASADVVAGGGIGGAEGCVWLGVEGTSEQMRAADELLSEVGSEPPFDA